MKFKVETDVARPTETMLRGFTLQQALLQLQEDTASNCSDADNSDSEQHDADKIDIDSRGGDSDEDSTVTKTRTVINHVQLNLVLIRKDACNSKTSLTSFQAQHHLLQDELSKSRTKGLSHGQFVEYILVMSDVQHNFIKKQIQNNNVFQRAEERQALQVVKATS